MSHNPAATCRKKKQYPDEFDAMLWAAFYDWEGFSPQWEYKCAVCKKYHLTSGRHLWTVRMKRRLLPLILKPSGYFGCVLKTGRMIVRKAAHIRKFCGFLTAMDNT